jgi:hypothetical protein
MGHGYAGIGVELYTNPRTAMLVGDAKAGGGRRVPLAGLLRFPDPAPGSAVHTGELARGAE